MTCTQACLLNAVLDHVPHGVSLFDAYGRVVAANRRFAATHPYVKDFAPGVSIDEIINSASAVGCFLDDPVAYVSALKADMAAGKQVTSQREFGDGRILLITNTPMPDGGWVTCQEDATARVTAERQIAFLARHDPLTRLPNRTEFEERLSVTVAERERACREFAVLCLDFDHFKDINDRFGHAIGDAFLREMSRRLEDAAGGELIARIGGDEFTVICGDASDAAGAALSRRIHSRVSGPVNMDGREAVASVSIGIALFPRDGSEPKTLVNHADQALYRAKREGRGVTRYYDARVDRSVPNAA